MDWFYLIFRVNKKYSFDDAHVPQIVKVMTVAPPANLADMEVESSDNDDNEDDPMVSEEDLKKCEQSEQQKLLVMKVNQELDMKIAAATGKVDTDVSYAKWPNMDMLWKLFQLLNSLKLERCLF